MQGEANPSARNATTLTWKNGKVSITDGPYAETKEQLGGILVLEARDLNHAIQLMSKQPGVKGTLRDSRTPKMFYKGLTFAGWSRTHLSYSRWRAGW